MSSTPCQPGTADPTRAASAPDARTSKFGRRVGWILVFSYAPMLLIEVPFILGITPESTIVETMFRFFAPLAHLAITVLWLAWAFLFGFARGAINGDETTRFRSGIVAAIVVVAFFAVPFLRHRLHTFGFYLMGRRAEPVITAVEAYIAKHGSPPVSLDLLIPDFIQSMPAGIPQISRAQHSDFPELANGEWGLMMTRTCGMPLGTEVLTYRSQVPVSPGERLGRWVLQFDDF